VTVACPACGAETFRLEREEGHGDAGFGVFCADCGNATAQVVARTLDERLQRDESQSGLGSYEGDR